MVAPGERSVVVDHNQFIVADGPGGGKLLEKKVGTRL
jgi:hypothetical protein